MLGSLWIHVDKMLGRKKLRKAKIEYFKTYYWRIVHEYAYSNKEDFFLSLCYKSFEYVQC